MISRLNRLSRMFPNREEVANICKPTPRIGLNNVLEPAHQVGKNVVSEVPFSSIDVGQLVASMLAIFRIANDLVHAADQRPGFVNAT